MDRAWRVRGKDLLGDEVVWFTEYSDDAERAVKNGWQVTQFVEVPKTYDLDARAASMIEHGMSNINWRPEDLPKATTQPAPNASEE